MPCLDISSFFDGSNNLHLISYLFWWSKCRDHYINLLHCLHQAFMMIYVSLWNNHMTFKINILIQSIKNTPTMWRTRVCTYMEKCHSRALEALNEFRLFRIRSCVFSDQCKSGVPSFRTFLHNVFSNVSSPPNYQTEREFQTEWIDKV